MRRTILLSILVICSLIQRPAHAQGCDVPVCDISAKITELRADTQAGRFAYVRALRTNNKTSRDAKIWSNLGEFAVQAKALFVELKEEDWLVNEASQLMDESNIALLKYERPFVADRATIRYNALGNENVRFESLAYWTGQIANLSDLNELQQVVDFSKVAEKTSSALGDSDYVPRQARLLATTATARYSILNPVFEGLYEIKIDCVSNGSSNAPCVNPGSDLTRMVVMNTQSSQGLVISLADVGGGIGAVYTLGQASLLPGGRGFEAVSSETDRLPSKVRVELNLATGEVQGWLRESTSSGLLRIQGKQLRTTAEHYKKTGSLGPASARLEGIYTGSWINSQVRLTLKELVPGRWMGSLHVSEGFDLVFQIGTYDQTPGVLNLVNASSDKNFFKLSMKVSEVNGTIHLDGFSLVTMSGRLNNINLTRVGDVDPQPLLETLR